MRKPGGLTRCLLRDVVVRRAATRCGCGCGGGVSNLVAALCEGGELAFPGGLRLSTVPRLSPSALFLGCIATLLNVRAHLLHPSPHSPLVRALVALCKHHREHAAAPKAGDSTLR